MGEFMLAQDSKLNDRYIIKQLLGEGGMSRVYLVEDDKLQGKLRALKEMEPVADSEDDSGICKNSEEMFRQEAEILCKLSHPNLPRILDFFSLGNLHYLVMEYVEGETLYDILTKTPGFIEENTLRDWGTQICEALEYLHGMEPPIIYRDIKPRNIILTPSGKLKLIDFGIARLFSEGKSNDTIIIGTPGFAPPEQYGKGQTDERSDIYSLGVTLYNLATKIDPSDKPFCFSISSTINPELSGAFDNAVLKAINLKPADRFASAFEFKESLSLRHTIILPFLSSPSESSLSLEISESHVVFELDNKNVPAEKVINIVNRGGKFLKATLSSNVPWLRIVPNYFEANKQDVTLYVDLSQERKSLKYRGKIILETEECSFPIIVTVNIKKTVFDSIIPGIGISIFLLAQSGVPLVSPFSIAYTYVLLDREEKAIQKYPTWASFGISVLNTLHFIGIF
jgi:serine/threonine protein kinase